MAHFSQNSQLTLSTVLLALLTSISTLPTYSQSTTADPASIERQPGVSQSVPESKLPPAFEARTELSPPASPEEIRQAQIATDTKKLYELAVELRTEVARTYKESLSMTVIKKAEEVEKLAKSLKARMSKEAVKEAAAAGH